MVVHQKENLEIVIKLGTPHKTKKHYSKEKAISLDPQLEENQLLQAQL